MQDRLWARFWHRWLGISLWPNIIPPSISIWEVAAPPQSQGFMLVGTLFILPIILGYTFWSYYVFRGKVSHEDGYHQEPNVMTPSVKQPIWRRGAPATKRRTTELVQPTTDAA